MQINLIQKSNINAETGRFLKGSIPHNKGKKWSEWVDGRKKRKMLRNLQLGRKNVNPKIAGANAIKIVAIKNGKFYPFESSEHAQRITGITARNIRSVCAGKRKKAGGFQWFYDKDINIWKHLLNTQ